MTRSERMKPVARVAETREQAAARDMGNAQRYLQEQQTRLTELIAYQADYQTEFEQRGRSGISVSRFQDMQRFLANLNTAIEQQQQVVAMATNTCEQKRRLWQQAYSKSQSLDRVVERYQYLELQTQERQEQKDMDEMAQRTVNPSLREE